MSDVGCCVCGYEHVPIQNAVIYFLKSALLGTCSHFFHACSLGSGICTLALLSGKGILVLFPFRCYLHASHTHAHYLVACAGLRWISLPSSNWAWTKLTNHGWT